MISASLIPVLFWYDRSFFGKPEFIGKLIAKILFRTKIINFILTYNRYFWGFILYCGIESFITDIFPNIKVKNRVKKGQKQGHSGRNKVKNELNLILKYREIEFNDNVFFHTPVVQLGPNHLAPKKPLRAKLFRESFLALTVPPVYAVYFRSSKNILKIHDYNKN